MDSYLELRRLLTRQLGTLQRVLLDQNSEFNDWPLLLESRDALHRLEDTCEDQRSAIQEWIDALDEWPVHSDPQLARERELKSGALSRIRCFSEGHFSSLRGHISQLMSRRDSAPSQRWRKSSCADHLSNP